MSFPFALIALTAYLSALVRVLAYRRNGARHRHQVSWVAWALVAVTGGSAIELIQDVERSGFFEAATAVLLAVFVNRVRGNVARLLSRNES